MLGLIRRGVVITCGLSLAGAVAGCGAEPSAEVAVREFLLAWQDGDFEAAAGRTTGDPEEVAAMLGGFHDQLDLAALRLGLGNVQRDGTSAEAAFDVQADLGIGDPVWSYEGEMGLTRDDGRWLVEWSPNVIHPLLGEGERLAVTYDVPDRGQILDRDDEDLVDETQVVAFGVRPAEMADMEEGIAQLAEELDEQSGPMLNRVRSAPPEDFQPLVLMRARDADASLVGNAEQIEGVETREVQMPLTPELAPGVVGEVAGTYEHNIANRVAGPYQAGDTVGLSGLQAAYQQRLAGTATTSIVTLDEGGEQVEVVEQWPGAASGTLGTTLDTPAQEAAENALSTIGLRASLVAVDVETGDILAAASQPWDLDNDDALTREYLPGNAFTIISAAALLRAGAVTPEQGVACEPERSVGDYTFQNRSGLQLWGEPEFTRVFANSCTNGFVELAEELEADDLARAAADFGIGAEWELPVEAWQGAVDSPAGAGEQAALAVGEDNVTVSPLSMALVAAAVADGTWRSPSLVPDDQLEQVQADEVPLDGEYLEPLREMMRASVVQGRANGANVGAVPVHGQSAVVQQVIGGEDHFVQWFVGYQGNVAFASTVELSSESSHQYAVGVAADFLTGLPLDYVELTAAQEEAQEQDQGS